jgi:hypothetical protein
MRLFDVIVPFDISKMLFSICFIPFSKTAVVVIYDRYIFTLLDFENTCIIGDFKENMVDLYERDEKSL